MSDEFLKAVLMIPTADATTIEDGHGAVARRQFMKCVSS
jgi:hypothetical protein